MKCPFCIKQCTKCGKILVANSNNFNKSKNGLYNLTSMCRKCNSKKCKEYKENKKENNPFNDIDPDKVWNHCPFCIKVCTMCGKILIANETNFNKKKKGLYGLDSRCNECRKKYREEHKEEKSEYDKKYNIENNEKKREYAKIYRKSHKNDEDYKKRNKESKDKWLKNNKEKRKEVSKRYSHKRRALVEGQTYTVEQWQECLEFFDYKCAYSGLDINLTIDHIIPLSKGGENYIWNLVPCYYNYNSSKNASDMIEWYKEQPFFDVNRLIKIQEWCIYAKNKWGNKVA